MVVGRARRSALYIWAVVGVMGGSKVCVYNDAPPIHGHIHKLLGYRSGAISYNY